MRCWLLGHRWNERWRGYTHLPTIPGMSVLIASGDLRFTSDTDWLLKSRTCKRCGRVE